TSGSYNAVTWLLDRNVDQGRGGKLAFTDTVSELTYGDLQIKTRRLANLLRRLGVRREERVAMIMLDTVDFSVVFLGAIRAGVLAVLIGFDRDAQGRAPFAFQSRSDGGDLCQAGARHSRRRRLPVGRKAVLRLRSRQCIDVPDVGRRHHRAQFRAADAAADVL